MSNLIEEIENLPRYDYEPDYGMERDTYGSYLLVEDVADAVRASLNEKEDALRRALVAKANIAFEAARDAARLEWLIRHGGMIRVQGSEERGWRVLDCRNGLTFLVDGHSCVHSFRDVIDMAMERLP